ncbi:MAG: bifunctional rhamnulose-1-phosphate aldolase/short-chain dehydrogenase [Anaerolineae bacterium]|nr:bifunctional rhamnulose-1-phosphate aldolase/short-chain dehydrogenase [Anaerolineae bacterium]
MNFKHLYFHWDDEAVAKMNALDRLVYRSNQLGADTRITNTGGGNTSNKASETDTLTGAQGEVLWVKGSGGDLRTSKRDNFASLWLDKLNLMRARYEATTPRGAKSQIEDDLVALYPHTIYNLNPRAPSIDTPLHGFVPHACVDHMHPNAVIAIAASANAEQLTREIYGDEVRYLAWQRPGFDLGVKLAEVCAAHPGAKGVILGKHGLINWAADDKACYTLTCELIERAAEAIEKRDKGEMTFGGQRYVALPEAERNALLVELLPWLRGQVSANKRMIATVHADTASLRFANSADAARLAGLGTSCPDHFLRTKIKPLFVDWNPASRDLTALKVALTAGLAQYRADYAAYYAAHKHPDSPAMRDPNPTVVLIPGVGMIAFGKDKSESRVTAEFYNCAIEVMRGAEALDRDAGYSALPLQEAFDIEYWLLEEAKLRRMPPEQELSRQVLCVLGAGSGIGREAALRLAREGAHVVCADRDLAGAQATAEQIVKLRGHGIGQAGTGISNCGPAIALAADLTDRATLRQMLADITLAYGGLDALVVTAGIFVSPDKTGHIPDERWATTYAINVTGAYLAADEAANLWRAQGLPANVVITTSANAVVAKKGSVAYDTSKAAANHLVRELAVELAPLVRVNGVAPATVVQGSAMFPRDRVIASLIKYEIAFDEGEDTEALRNKLARFYAERTLLKTPITPADQAEAIYLLLTSQLRQTTGQIITVDGGLVEAFLR